MAIGATAFALVIVMNGWVEGGPASRGNVIHHIPGFSSAAKCGKAGDAIRNGSVKPEIVKTTCVETTEPFNGYAVVLTVSGWDNEGSGSRGNSVDHIAGFLSLDTCQKAATKILEISSSATKGTCVEF